MGMARMTPAEATAVNNVISYIAAKDPTPAAEVVRSLHILASRAHNRLQGDGMSRRSGCSGLMPSAMRDFGDGCD